MQTKVKTTEIRKSPEATKSWMWALCFLVCLIASVTTIFVNVKCGIDTRDLSFLCFITFAFNLFVFVQFIFVFVRTEHIKDVEYFVYEFEKWIENKCGYEKRYFVGTKTLSAKFILHKHICDIEESLSEKEIVEKANDISNFSRYSSWDGHDTKEAAMLEIIKKVKKVITDKKEKESTKVRNVAIAERHSAEDLEQKCEDKKFDEFIKKHTT